MTVGRSPQNKIIPSQQGLQAPVKIFDRQLVTVFAVFKGLIVLSFIGFFLYFPGQHGNNLWNRYYSGTENLDAVYLPFSNWDGQNYLLLADRGYAHWRSGQAFFPLYPLLISLINFFLKNTYLSAFLLNLVLSYLFAYAYFAYSLHSLSRETALKGLVLVLSYPTAFFLTAFYAEALFLFLLFGFLLSYDARHSYTSLPFALLLPLARGQGVFIPVALVIALAIRVLKRKAIDYRYEACNLLAFVIGGFLYLLFFYHVTGSPFSGLEVQKNFVFGNDISHIFNPAHFIDYLFTPYDYGFVFACTNSLIDKVFIILFLLAMVIILIRPGSMLWVVLSIVLFYPVAAMGYGGSFTRFSLPVAVVLSLLLGEARPMGKRMLSIVSSLLLALQLYFVYRFSLNLWVG